MGFPEVVIVQIPGPQGTSGVSGITTPNSAVSRSLPGLLAYGYNVFGSPTPFSTVGGGQYIPGCTIVVPPTTYAVEITFGAWITITTAGAGSVSLWVYEWSLGATNARGTANKNLSNIPLTQASTSLAGEIIVPSSTAHRVFTLSGAIFRDSSSLAVSSGNLPVSPSYIKATAI